MVVGSVCAIDGGPHMGGWKELFELYATEYGRSAVEYGRSAVKEYRRISGVL